MSFEEIKCAFKAQLPDGVAFALEDPRVSEDGLHVSEMQQVSHAVSKRRREFASGRRAARRALGYLACKEIALPIGEDRAPIWPPDVVGSISHCKDACIAVLGKSDKFQSIGVDIECIESTFLELAEEICTPQELIRLKACEAVTRKRLAQIFSAKEATYKAQFPISKALFGFETIDVEFQSENLFTSRFCEDVLPFKKGDILRGQAMHTDTHVVHTVFVE